MVSASQRTGFTLPGMMEEPGWMAGRLISPMEQRGPEPSRRMSFAILKREVAMALSWPCASTRASRAAWASNGFSARWHSKPVRSLRRAIAVSGKVSWRFRPVPMAVPPRGSSNRDLIALWQRSIPRSACFAYPENSWPSRIGTASIRWVRPIFRTS